MAKIHRRILGLDFNGKPIFAPKHAHSPLLSAADGAIHSFSEDNDEPPSDQRNAYWRDEPRTILEKPGTESVDGDEALRALALHNLGISGKHASQDIEAAASEPKPSTPASFEDLEKAGMLDG